MNAIKCENRDLLVYIPAWISFDDGTESSFSRRVTESVREFDNIAVDHEQWILICEDQYIRFKRHNTEAVRKYYFEFCLAKSQTEKPLKSLDYIESAANLLDVELRTLVDELNRLRESNESFQELYRKYVNLQKGNGPT